MSHLIQNKTDVVVVQLCVAELYVAKLYVVELNMVQPCIIELYVVELYVIQLCVVELCSMIAVFDRRKVRFTAQCLEKIVDEFVKAIALAMQMYWRRIRIP